MRIIATVMVLATCVSASVFGAEDPAANANPSAATPPASTTVKKKAKKKAKAHPTAVVPPAETAPALSPAVEGGQAVAGGPIRTKYGVAAMIGYGLSDVFKLGFGVKGGTTLNEQFYAGARFMYHLGSSQTVNTVSADAKVWILAVEGGYNFPLQNKMTLRPYLGVGLAGVTATVNVGPLGVMSASSTNVAVIPGAALNIDLDKTYCGADLSLAAISNATALTIAAHYGWYF